jgi:membrane associated rhomboid family serine protease
MFMHGGFTHILFNMYTLFIFGSVLERVWGSQKFLFYYFVTGIGAALLHLGVMALQLNGYIADLNAGNMFAQAGIQDILTTPTVGASGAIYGLLLAYGMLFPNNIMQLIFPPVALKAKWFVIIFGALELLLGLSGRGGDIAHFAHLGGMIFGFFLILYWKKNNRMYY